MKRIHGMAVAFALACVPALSAAQQYQDNQGYYDDRAPTVDAEARAYDDEYYDERDERRYEDERRYQDERYADQRQDPRYDQRYDPRYDQRRDPRYDERHDPRYDERYADQGHGYEGNCNPRTNHVAPVIGFIIGGLLGNQFGHGAGRAAATGAGASLGHAVGIHAANNCADRYAPHAAPVQMGMSFYGGGGGGGYYGGHGSGYSLFLGTALPFLGYGGYGGGYWANSQPWRWHGH